MSEKIRKRIPDDSLEQVSGGVKAKASETKSSTKTNWCPHCKMKTPYEAYSGGQLKCTVCQQTYNEL